MCIRWQNVLNATIMHIRNIHSLKHKVSLTISKENKKDWKYVLKVLKNYKSPKLTSNNLKSSH